MFILYDVVMSNLEDFRCTGWLIFGDMYQQKNSFQGISLFEVMN